MKMHAVFVLSGLLFASGKLYAQANENGKLENPTPKILDLEPMKFDSLEASLNSVGANAFLMAKNMWNMKKKVDDVDPNMPILKPPKNYSGALKIKELPMDYPSRMPILQLDEGKEPEVIVPLKK